MKKVPETRWICTTDPQATGDPAWVRGYFANLFSGNPLFGNHGADGESLYLFPRIQYRLIRGAIVVIGIAEGAETVAGMNISPRHIRLGRKEFMVVGIDLEARHVQVGSTERPEGYRFVRPWMPLNQENHDRFQGMSGSEQEGLLRRILIGNLLTLAKGVGETVCDEVVVSRLDVRSRVRMTKGQPMLVFDGEFDVNFRIPEDWAIGKGGSRGFGVVQGRACGGATAGQAGTVGDD